MVDCLLTWCRWLGTMAVVASTVADSGMDISGSGSRLKLFLPPALPTRILDISEADTLHDLDRYSMGSSGVCGGGIPDSSSSSWTISMRKTSPAFQPLSMAIPHKHSALGNINCTRLVALTGRRQQEAMVAYL